MTKKLIHYLNACRLTQSLNLKGLPLWPKKLFPFLPHDRTGYNGFLTWVATLQLTDVSVVVDAGANHGDFSEAAATFFPHARFLLVEPFPKLHPELEFRCHRHGPAWSLEKYALGDKESSETLYISHSHDAIGSLKGFPDSYSKATSIHEDLHSISCQVRCLDNVLAEKNISSVSLLKIDVEGAEFELLSGAENTFNVTDSIIIEVSTIRDSELEANALLRVLALLDEKSFRPVAILPSLFDRNEPWMPVEFNVLARRSNATR
jgi:FkbM family methyltransferase